MLNLPTTEERLGKSPRNLLRFALLFMALLYVAVGLGLLLTAHLPLANTVVPLTPFARQMLGVVFMLYGAVRLSRVYREHFAKSSTSSHDDAAL